MIAFGQIIDIKNMELQIKIQSFSDIITNSSSETFILNSSENFKEISSLLKKIGEEHWYKGSWSDWDNLHKEEQGKYDTGSGMGGDIEVRNWESLYEEYKEYIPENKKDLYTNKTGELAMHTGADIFIKPLMCSHADPNKLYISLFTGLNDIKRMNLDHDEPDMEMIITCQSFDSYRDVLFSSNAFCGILINPFTDHLGFSKDMLDEMFYNKETIN